MLALLATKLYEFVRWPADHDGDEFTEIPEAERRWLPLHASEKFRYGLCTTGCSTVVSLTVENEDMARIVGVTAPFRVFLGIFDPWRPDISASEARYNVNQLRGKAIPVAIVPSLGVFVAGRIEGVYRSAYSLFKEGCIMYPWPFKAMGPVSTLARTLEEYELKSDERDPTIACLVHRTIAGRLIVLGRFHRTSPDHSMNIARRVLTCCSDGRESLRVYLVLHADGRFLLVDFAKASPRPFVSGFTWIYKQGLIRGPGDVRFDSPPA